MDIICERLLHSSEYCAKMYNNVFGCLVKIPNPVNVS